ncbi:hypothetical protein R3X27_00475 [Tropicimonas sp. TH_r6]|uniref:hypothetical protein n=1 Tax=Tropicimonas sp. TH_r6 TaxID=3082085 RepID=UPI0029537E5A|nr:hypothetical protein [Tropicimonas sp. TH_r6]MDV7141145.1 hypothetical protein [Tropicimonas sp. TH_r6]
MARRLEFRNGCGEQLLVEMRNRRLHRADFASAREDSVAVGEFDAVSLSYAGAETLHAFLSALRAFCAPEGLWVRSMCAVSPADPDETGVSIGTLRYLLAQAPETSCQEVTERAPFNTGVSRVGLADFLADESSWLEAGLLVSNGQECPVRGVSDQLVGLSKALETAGARLASRAVQPAAVFLEAAGERGEHLAFLAYGSERLALLVSPSGKDAFLSRWSEWLAACDIAKKAFLAT